MLSFLLDIHRNILSIQGFVRCTSDNISKIQITLKTNSLCLEYYKDLSLFHCLKILMPDNFLQPSTVSSISSNNSGENVLLFEDSVVKMCFSLLSDQVTSNEEIRQTEATFRLQMFDDSNTDGCILKNGTGLHFKDFMQGKYEKYETFCVFCTTCCSLLTDKVITIKSVLKYYEDISDSAETWFCHKHEDHKSVNNSNDLLYISDMHLYFHDSVIKSFMLSESNKCYKCMKCLSNLSFKKKMNKPHYIGFFADKIMLGELETEAGSIQKYRRDVALFSFCSAVQDLLKIADFCNLYLQSKVDEKSEVLLVKFNSQKVVQFLLHEENEDEMPSEIEFKTKEVYKVLYCVSSPDSELSKKWKHDFSVDFFLISDNMMAVIRDLLQESSNYLPSNQETVDGFSFGYLPAHVSIV